jgi:hypothetical protein
LVSHDNIADVIGVTCESFEDIFVEKAKEFKRLVMEYVKIVRGASEAGSGSGTGSGNPSLTVQLDPKGFPIVPSPSSWDKLTKDDLEKLYRSYITQHYRMSIQYMPVIIYSSPSGLAAGVKDRQAPFSSIANKQSNFVQRKYIPRGVTLQDPRAMRREAITKFFKHIAAREASHGIQNAFRFKAVLSSRKKGNLCNTSYFDDDEPALSEEQALDDEVEPDLAGGSHIILDSNPALSPITSETTSDQSGIGQGPAPVPVPGLGPPTKRTKRARDKSRAGNSVNSTNPELSLDPAFRIDPPIILDPGLEFHPFTNSQSLSGEPFPLWTHLTSTSSTTRQIMPRNTLGPDLAHQGHSAGDEIEPEPATIPIQNRRSPRRQAINAEALAREEALKLTPKRMTRRR